MKKIAVIFAMFFLVDSAFAINWGRVAKSVGKSIEKHSAKDAGFNGASHRFEQGASHNFEHFGENASHAGGPSSPHIDPSSTGPDFSYNPAVYHAIRKYRDQSDSSEIERRREFDLYIKRDLYPKQEKPRYKDEVDYIRRSMAAQHRIGDFHPYQHWLDTHQDLLKERAEKNKIYVNQRYHIDFLPMIGNNAK